MRVWRGPNGFQIEVITLDRRACYRITQRVNDRRYILAYTRSIYEIAAHVDLADLVEVVHLHQRRRAQPPAGR
ncbi:hypothetical protein [Nonomuraea sp. NPDC050202]|uniref:hypothetical protein n=1 Tax=Nonomuraea sp. NPDC050202 TaxID=3155035 RepID=UPI0033EFAAE0